MAKRRHKTGSGSDSNQAPKTSKRSIAGSRDPSVAQLRARLRQSDQALLKHLNERAKLVRLINERDPKAGQAITSLASDALKGLRVKKSDILPVEVVNAVYREILSGCRQLIRPLEIAYLGPQYSYSHLAAQQHFGESARLSPVGTIPAVFDAVHRGDVQFGVVPLENSTDGRITDTMDMFTRTPAKISAEVQLRIHHNLLGKCTREGVRIVCSKPQALSQCRRWLTEQLPGAQQVEMASTTLAAERAAREEGVAAVASLQAGRHYGLDVIAPSIEDNRHNVTRFAVIGQEMAERTGRDITSVMFQLYHRPGALAEAMNIFKRNRLNLTWIESFPMPGCPSEYLFFVELEGYATDLRVRKSLDSLRQKTERLDILGSYARCDPVD